MPHHGGCDTNPHWLYQGSLLAAAIAWVTVLCVPRKAVGGSAYVLQLAAQGAFTARSMLSRSVRELPTSGSSVNWLSPRNP
ncbi:hypothetical protein [Streptomyces niveus]|uniref:hypothetical protein n=1 Tax=Streptomyces niveus TaxID=193462 RepID=UPI003422CA98